MTDSVAPIRATDTAPPPPPQKKPYQTPVLIVHGRIDQITKALIMHTRP
ncbi:MAG: hypothetical protein LAP40_23805 [Acidobacteriia bacterium]|nr:hypothetical protein [Terriglobia bacterium]